MTASTDTRFNINKSRHNRLTTTKKKTLNPYASRKIQLIWKISYIKHLQKLNGGLTGGRFCVQDYVNHFIYTRVYTYKENH